MNTKPRVHCAAPRSASFEPCLRPRWLLAVALGLVVPVLVLGSAPGLATPEPQADEPALASLPPSA